MIYVEKDFNKNVIAQLEAMGYKIEERDSIGITDVIIAKDGKITAGSGSKGR